MEIWRLFSRSINLVNFFLFEEHQKFVTYIQKCAITQIGTFDWSSDILKVSQDRVLKSNWKGKEWGNHKLFLTIVRYSPLIYLVPCTRSKKPTTTINLHYYYVQFKVLIFSPSKLFPMKNWQCHSWSWRNGIFNNSLCKILLFLSLFLCQ